MGWKGCSGSTISTCDRLNSRLWSPNEMWWISTDARCLKPSGISDCLPHLEFSLPALSCVLLNVVWEERFLDKLSLWNPLSVLSLWWGSWGSHAVWCILLFKINFRVPNCSNSFITIYFKVQIIERGLEVAVAAAQCHTLMLNSEFLNFTEIPQWGCPGLFSPPKVLEWPTEPRGGWQLCPTQAAVSLPRPNQMAVQEQKEWASPAALALLSLAKMSNCYIRNLCCTSLALCCSGGFQLPWAPLWAAAPGPRELFGKSWAQCWHCWNCSDMVTLQENRNALTDFYW